MARSAPFLLTSVWILAVVLMPAAAAAQPFTITNYRVDLDLRADRTMHVSETISTRFNEQRRGIIREIPIRYDTGKGFRRNLSISNLSVTDEKGVAQEAKITYEGDNLKIRVGNENVWFTPGTRKIYVLQYDARGMLNWFARGEWEPNVELYWNLTGDQWDTNMEHAEFTVKFPGEGKILDAKLFYGSYGSTSNVQLSGKDSAATADGAIRLARNGNQISGEAKTGFDAYQGWSVVLALPEKAIPRPTPMQEALDFARANPIVFLPIALFAILFTGWLSFGRDPKPGPRVVQFDPPDGLTAAQCGTLLDESVDQRDIAAGFVELATKGYLTMELIPGEGWFQKNKTVIHMTGKASAGDLSEFEEKLLQLLHLTGKDSIDDVELKTEIGPEIATLRGLLHRSLTERKFYGANPTTIRAVFWGLGILLVVCGCFGGEFFGLGQGSTLVTIAALGCSAVLVIAFGHIMPRRTHLGVAAWNRVRGFEEFIRRARSDELRWMEKKEPNQALFETLLPYAVAFGLTKEWAEAFRNIELHQPSWYATPHGYHFVPYSFADDLSQSTSGLAAAASTPPRSSGGSGGHSGFGGGGFSGGGFGGGGGSSW